METTTRPTQSNDKPSTGMESVLQMVAKKYGYSYTGYRMRHGLNVFTAVYRDGSGVPRVITALTPYFLCALIVSAPQVRYVRIPDTKIGADTSVATFLR